MQTEPQLKRPDLFRSAILIGGEWVKDSSAGEPIAVVDPATGRLLGTVPNAGRAETARAIEAADAAFPAWREKTAAERADHLRRLAQLITDNKEDLARILTAEQGKPLAEARGEVGMSAAYVQWFAEEGRRIYGDVIPSPWQNRRILITKDPVGVVGAITPWNFPSSMIARKLGAALAAGCTIVIKPASQTPYSALAWGVLCEEAGIPAGVVNILTGAARQIGAELTSNPLVKKITFTGSTEVGKQLAEQAARTMKKVSMELGGNAPFIVFDDADLDRAVEGAMVAKYRNAGQTCVCTNRFLVQEGIYDAFAERLARASAAMKVGNGFEEGVVQGPLIDERAVAKVEEHIADALAKGGRLLTGGRRHQGLGGNFFEPTVIADATPAMAVAREETFGPLAPLFRFRDEAEAVRLANDTEYGLACYFYTRDLGRAFRVSEALEYGLVGINEGLITTEVAPFGGVKESGVGREGSKYGIDDYLNIKYVCVGGL
ncbi:NAD-dependent succinate-semialdehyde dehydrogenase [Chelatococcus composti]|jgi:succinate-semialdehyde dehydrogenase/glutarate-semialdehyde dehydrogenase|uniref:Succinate-semialdehyde dehydrogenase/glutarate-semialdehyde dehydrogenase n=1 Tax=Chelatococcus composti TaxID=1743235 RepID=A0A841KJS1_9HYPH|nr:NAD-dependent succinate-semialdehyde dehydrogenase [Chelatococcus composti]MBB6169519.1 succinate-semialdehyde dehydrogenase/glutarate-semialdehyde dehydrogenase [Chelatococcus composti]MBS7736104.1 NAD-dependent succinate-semialdehyde dehydrogenase [Chelatococcus composti]PZN44832.1 MAG: succinate-semialdehyde dehydrogenase (NADP(+)) [Pseudomonadota bacterium]GGG48334.1 NAD-dependent succinate-semialdehyde dehydrogenase [Chelatococcus composti]